MDSNDKGRRIGACAARPCTAEVAMRTLVTLVAVAAAGLVPAAAGASAQAATAGPEQGLNAAAVRHEERPAPPGAKPTIAYRGLTLANGQTATVFSNGVAEVFSADHKSDQYRMVPSGGPAASGTTALPSRGQLIWDLSRAPASAYVPGTLEVVLARGVSAAGRTVPAAVLRHAAGHVAPYTTSAALNRVLAGIGADSMSAVFGGAAARAVPAGPAGLDLRQAFAVHVTGASVPAAVARLLASPAVAYAAPDWTVSAMHTQPTALPAATRKAAASLARKLAAHRSALGQPSPGSGLPPVPTNFALQTSEQALLNRPGTDWVPAYEALEARYHQLPGTGETITDVSLGDLDSAGLPSSDPCSFWTSAFGPTTVIQNGQRYLDMPSMPLIPTWTSSAAGLDPTGEVCSVDPFDTEIDLDFSMMAPLPDGMQRAGELGSGLTDLLGIAPGASYRLVVPSDTTSSITSVDQALLSAAQQSPRPNVITASLAFGLDAEGMPSRYLEDDPLTEALITSLVHQYHINVSISSGDGLRTFTNASVSPDGGAAATGVTPPGGNPSSLNDVQLSGAPSSDFDSGSIDAGGTTLDDIFAAPPQDNPGNTAQQAFPEVRWDGSADYASGFGARVNVSAPGDDVAAFEHTQGGAPDAVTVVNQGGTSASAQEIGAAAAVVQQAARLTGNQQLTTNPLAVRSYLARTGSPVAPVSQADRAVPVGPQVDLGSAVTGLVATAGYHLPASVARVAVAQRQPLFQLDTFFSTVTDPGAISLAGVNQNALVTIAPDWTGLPAGTSYHLYALSQSGGRKLLASGPSARLLPDTILAAAGLSPSTQLSQAVSLSYVASSGGQPVASATIPLAFTPVSGTPMPLAPLVPPVVRGPDISVRYDLTGQTGFTAPQLVVSPVGRVNPLQKFFWPAYHVALHATSGTAEVPVSALTGDGVYGIGIESSPAAQIDSDFAVTRVQATPSGAQPAAPLLSAPGSTPGHLLTIPYGGSFTVSWDVRNVPHAAGAMLEISAAGPNDYNSWATFNNPNGSVRDHDGHDRGSVYFAKLPGPSGSMTLKGTTAGLYATLYHNVRVIPALASGGAAGEGSPVSSVTMNGVAPSDGGFASGGFGINATGTDGFLTSNQINAAGKPQSSVETFSQSTQQVTGTVAAATNADQYSTLSFGDSGVFAGDTGLYADSTATSTAYDVLHPVGSGTAAGQWTPPAALQPLPNTNFQAAVNQASNSEAMLSFQFGAGGQPQVFTTNVGANTFGPAYSIAPTVQGFGFPFFTGTAQDTATGTAVVAAADLDNLNAGPTLVTVNLANGTVGTIPGVGNFYSSGVAVDPGTGTAAGPEILGVGLYNLGTGSGTFVTLGGSVYQHPADDPGAQGYTVEEVSPPRSSGLGTTLDNNAISAELVINAQGQVVRRIERFQFFNVSTLIAGATTQLNQSGTGYTLGLDGQQLEPFKY
jgi:hypothetical protein